MSISARSSAPGGLHGAAVRFLAMLPAPVGALGLRVTNRLARTTGRRHVCRTYFGARMYCRPPDLIQTMIMHFGVWEPNVSAVIEGLLGPGDVFLDLGANVGYDALLGARCVGPAGSVVAVEASPATFAALQENLALNAAGNVRPVNAAVSDRAGRVRLYSPTRTNSGRVTTLEARGGTSTEEIDARTLDEILSDEEAARLRLVKIDIEGAEVPVLRHILARIDRFSPLLAIVAEITPEDDPAGWADAFEGLRAAGFRAFAIDNGYGYGWYLKWRRPSPLVPLDAVPGGLADVLFTREDPPPLAARTTAADRA